MGSSPTPAAADEPGWRSKSGRVPFDRTRGSQAGRTRDRGNLGRRRPPSPQAARAQAHPPRCCRPAGPGPRRGRRAAGRRRAGKAEGRGAGARARSKRRGRAAGARGRGEHVPEQGGHRSRARRAQELGGGGMLRGKAGKSSVGYWDGSDSRLHRTPEVESDVVGEAEGQRYRQERQMETGVEALIRSWRSIFLLFRT